jgi:hypothetical protein
MIWKDMVGSVRFPSDKVLRATLLLLLGGTKFLLMEDLYSVKDFFVGQ